MDEREKKTQDFSMKSRKLGWVKIKRERLGNRERESLMKTSMQRLRLV